MQRSRGKWLLVAGCWWLGRLWRGRDRDRDRDLGVPPSTVILRFVETLQRVSKSAEVGP